MIGVVVNLDKIIVINWLNLKIKLNDLSIKVYVFVLLLYDKYIYIIVFGIENFKFYINEI